MLSRLGNANRQQTRPLARSVKQRLYGTRLRSAGLLASPLLSDTLSRRQSPITRTSVSEI